MTPDWGVVSTGGRGRRRRDGVGARFAAVLLLGLAGGVAVVAHGTASLTGSGLPAFAFVGFAGLAVAGDGDDGVDRLVAKIERFEAGEDVDFDTDREDDLGRLYDAVGSLAASAAADDGEAERYRRELYRIASDPDLESEAKVRRLLDLGCERLDVENGLVTRIDERTGRYEVETVAGGEFVAPGVVTDVDETFCRRTITSSDVLAIYDASEAAAESSPGDAAWDVDCYIGARIETDGDLYGTVCFVDPEPRANSFTHAEKAFVDLLARWVSQEIERRERTAELRLRTRALESAPVGVTITDPTREDNPIVYVNDRFTSLTGYPADEAVGRNCRFLQGEGTAEEPVAALRAAVDAGESVTTELRNYRRDGTEFWNRVSVAPVEDESGELTNFVGFQEDVTERVERERRLEAIVENTSDPIYIKDRDGAYRFANEAAADVFGTDGETLIGKTDAELFDEETAERIRDVDERVMETGEPVTEEARNAIAGETRVFLDDKYPYRDEDGEVIGLMGISRDVTERKQRERELERQANLLDTLFEQIPVNLYLKDREGRHVRTSAPALDETYPDDEEWFRGKTNLDVYPDRFAEETHADDMRVIEEGESIIEKAEYNPEDETWVVTSKVPWRDEDGDVQGLIGLSQSITEQKERERELRETKRTLELVLEGTNTGVWELDLATNEVIWNETLERMVGLEPGEFAGTYEAFEERVHPEDVSQVVDALDEALESDDLYQAEFRLRHEDGHWIWVSARGRVVFDEEGHRRMVGINNDVTERKETERRLSRLIDNVPGYVYRSAAVPPWEIEFVSEGVADITGYDPDELENGAVNWDADVIADRNEDIEAQIERALDAREPFYLTYPIDTADGERRWVKEQGRGVYAADGSVEAIEGVVIDITEQRAYERELERTSWLLEKSQQIAAVGGWTTEMADGEPQQTRWTEKLFDIFELSREEAPFGDEVIEFYHPEDRPERRAAVERAIETGEGWDDEARVITAAGNERWVRTTGEPVVEGADGERESGDGSQADDDEVVALHGTVQDITEQKERERELERTKDLLQQAGRIAEVGGWELDLTADPPEMSWTDQLYDIHGVEAGTDVDVETAVDCYHPDDREYIQQRFRAAMERGESYDMEVRLNSEADRHRWVRAMGEAVSEDGEVVTLRGSIQDITDQKEREQELRATKDRMQKFIETSPVGVVATDPEGNVTLWNDGMEAIFGWRESEVLGEPYPAVPDSEGAAVDSVRQRVLDGEPVSQVELERVTKDGRRIDVSLSAGPIRDESGTVTEIVGYIEDITERKERELELERTKDMLAQAQQLAGIGGWEIDLTTEPETLTWTDELYRIHGLEPGTEIQLDEALDFYHPDDESRIRESVERVVETGGSYDEEARIRTADGEQRWVRAIGKAIREDGETVTVRGALQDITRQKERELALQSLHEAARGLLNTESEREVAELVVETAADLFDVPGVAVYAIDEASNRLVPTASTEAFEALSDGAPTVGVGDDAAVWNCFATGERVVFDDAEAARQSRVFGEAVDSALLVPMGDHGVFVVATDGPRIDDETRRLAETLVATTEAAFDRLASEADLRQRDAELETQNQRLRRQVGINDIIRRVDQSLVGATSREEVESAVCERLAESDDVAFAWIGGFEGGDDELVPRTWAGTGQTYLDALSLDDLAGAAEPAMATATSGEPTVVGNVVDRLREDAWRRGALANDFHSVISVPLAVDDYSHGVLTVYADEPDVFGDLERTVFAELGRSIANAINAVSAREALHADTVVELTLQFEDPEGVLARVARDAGCEVEYEGISTRSADETRLFFATSGAAAEDVAAVLDELYAVTEFRQVSESDDEDRYLFEATVTGTVLPSALVDQGASPRSIRATPTGMEAVVDLPTSTDVREFVETLREAFPSVELGSRRNVERGMGTRQQMLSSLLGELTDRQLEVLRTAYFAGFFEWPRASTGEEVAEMLDVTQPTVNRHLRLGQQRLLAQLFDEEAPDLVAA